MHHLSSVLILLGLLVASEARPAPVEPATSITYFESGPSSKTLASEGQWTLLHPLRINHNAVAHADRRPFVKPAKKPKLVSQTVSGPPGYTKEYFGNFISEVDTPRSYVKPAKKKYLVKQTPPPPPQMMKPPRSVAYVHPYSGSFGQQPAQGNGINVQQLVNKFGLVGMKPLLNPKVARQLVPPEPSLQAVESRLLLTPFAFYKANQMFVPLNNQPVPIKTMAVALQQARQGSILLNAPPPSLDADLIPLLNRSSRKYGFEKDAAKLYAASNELYDDLPALQKGRSGGWKRMDADEETDQIGVALFAPDFRRLTKSRRMRTSTLGAIGYQS